MIANELNTLLDLNYQEDRDWITIGTVGHPNVGKSSLINGIIGKKVVSVSKTPGHTKHFQTIHLSDQVRLCDCPGLVFPALIPKPVQILSGMYSIAQVQEPYTAVTYLAERTPLVQILSLTHPDQEENEGFYWSGWRICEAFALQRGFLTPKAARPDVYRAANLILRMANDGRLLLIFRPIGFSKLLASSVMAADPGGKSREEEILNSDSSSSFSDNKSSGFDVLEDETQV